MLTLKRDQFGHFTHLKRYKALRSHHGDVQTKTTKAHVSASAGFIMNVRNKTHGGVLFWENNQ